ncbi:MAG: DUF2889 domain-containing protein [Rubrivivax sp.]|nr:DUF2889 domain-containing protein [Rubrivivax sp.]
MLTLGPTPEAPAGATPALPVFRRCIDLHAALRPDGSLRVRAALEDDFHHFRVELVATDGHVTAIQTQAPRHPYSLCPAAGQQVQGLVGAALSSHAHAMAQRVDPRQQCTHVLDLAGLAAAQAVRGPGRRRYDISVPLRQQGRTRATLARDGAPLLDWDLQDLDITGPAPYAGMNLRVGLARWALANLSQDDAEAALVLRRAAAISLGKGVRLDAQVHAHVTGRCWVQQEERAPQALRQVGSTWDFTARAEALCADDAQWLAT